MPNAITIWAVLLIFFVSYVMAGHLCAVRAADEADYQRSSQQALQTKLADLTKEWYELDSEAREISVACSRKDAAACSKHEDLAHRLDAINDHIDIIKKQLAEMPSQPSAPPPKSPD